MRGSIVVALVLLCCISFASALLPSSGIFVFGNNSEHSSCLEPIDARLEPQQTIKSVMPSEVASLGLWWPMIALLKNGTVIGCGINITSGTWADTSTIYEVQVGPRTWRQNVTSFSVGGSHANFLLGNGSVVVAGTLHGSGFSLDNSVSFPAAGVGKDVSGGIVLDRTENEEIISIASGAYCGAAVTSKGHVWMWGGCAIGECGQGYFSRNNTEPKRVEYKNGENHFVRQAVLGNGASALVTDSYILTAGTSTSIGRNTTEPHGMWFEKVPGSDAREGGPAYPFHTMGPTGNGFWVLDAHRKLWAFGSGRETWAAGGSTLRRIVCFSDIFEPFDSSIEDLATTYQTVFVLTSSGTLYTWGRLLHTPYDANVSLPIPITFSAYNSSTSIISRIHRPTGGRLMFFDVEPICNSCILIPPGGPLPPIVVSGPMTFIGNLTANPSTPITITVVGNLNVPWMNVTGCVDIPGGITLDLTSSPAITHSLQSKTPVTVPILEASCIRGTMPTITTRSNLKECQKVQTKHQTRMGPTGRVTLLAMFTVDDSKCNAWWIILVCVVGGVIVIAGVAIGIGYLIRKRTMAKPKISSQAQ